MNYDDIINAVRDIVHERTPDTDISDILYQHKCFYLLSKLPTFASSPAFNTEKTLNRIAIKERYKTCEPLFARLDIPYAVIKGAVLSDLIYKDPAIRFSGDIDLLINRRDADRVKEILTSFEFVQGRVTGSGIVPFTRKEILFQTTMSHQTAPYVKQTNNRLCPYINVDINTDIIWGESNVKTDIDSVLMYTQTVNLLGFDFRKLTPAMEFISLCLHHYKDMNSLYLLSSGSLKLGLFCDIYYYLRNVSLSLEELCELCGTLNVGKYIYACLYDTYKIFNDQFLVKYINALDSQKDLSLLDTFGLSQSERKPWGLSLSERLFHPRLQQYIDTLLSNSEKEKIILNREYM